MKFTKEINFVKQLLLFDNEENNDFFLKFEFNNEFNWEFFLLFINNNHLEPYIYNQLKERKFIELIPGQIKIALKFNVKQEALNKLSRSAVFAELSELFASQNIQFITLKGMALETTLYGNLAIRPMIDIDILLPQEQLQKIEYELIKRGAIKIPIYESNWIASLSHQSEPLIYKSVAIELHRNITDQFDLWQIEPDELWEHVIPQRIGHFKTHTFEPNFLLVYLCHHAYNTVKGGKIKLISYLDIYILLCTNILDWEKCYNIIIKYNIQKSVFHSLGFVQWFFNYNNYPEQIAIAIKQYCLQPQLILSIAQDFKINTTKEHYYEKFRRIKGLTGKAKYIKGKMFPTKAFIQYKYKRFNALQTKLRMLIHVIGVMVQMVNFTLKIIIGHKIK